MEKTISAQRIYEGRVLNLRIDTVELDDGRTTRREIVEHGGSVVIVPIDAGGNVLLVRQYRKPVEAELLELPAGGIEAGETPEACVQRELQEETGYLAGNIKALGGFYSAPGFCTEYLHLFLATDLRPAFLAMDTDEAIQVVRVPLVQTPDLIAGGQIVDAKSVAGLLWAVNLLKDRSD